VHLLLVYGMCFGGIALQSFGSSHVMQNRTYRKHGCANTLPPPLLLLLPVDGCRKIANGHNWRMTQPLNGRSLQVAN
jgi:hypothetical protein